MNQKLESAELRNFALIMAGLVALFFGALLPWLWNWRFPAWPWYVAIALVAGGLLAPLSLRIPYRLWMRLGHALGWVNTRLLLGIIFYLMITPMGLVMRLFGWDPMRRRLDAAAKTYKVKSRPLSRNEMETPY
ncbi:MAG: sxtJ [Gammaproteobacteria bacterium]|nr:sxtJ [Gammaproteobacteria bacterium]MBU1647638.1 sxtJ [Gammaproteobacteria bacterium]MBU1971526.1 sxtJ [Gammaproteobacteria bacterium]